MTEKVIFFSRKKSPLKIRKNSKKSKKLGTSTYQGMKYVGEWKDDKEDGIGRLYENENEVFDGRWKNGKKEGQGTSDISRYFRIFSDISCEYQELLVLRTDTFMLENGKTIK